MSYNAAATVLTGLFLAFIAFLVGVFESGWPLILLVFPAWVIEKLD